MEQQNTNPTPAPWRWDPNLTTYCGDLDREEYLILGDERNEEGEPALVGQVVSPADAELIVSLRNAQAQPAPEDALSTAAGAQARLDEILALVARAHVEGKACNLPHLVNIGLGVTLSTPPTRKERLAVVRALLEAAHGWAAGISDELRAAIPNGINETILGEYVRANALSVELAGILHDLPTPEGSEE